MSLSSTTSRVGYVGNGAVSTYSYTFKVFAESDLRVTVKNLSNVETVLTIATDYTVTGVGVTAGGSIVLVNSAQAWLDAGGDLLTGFTLTIRRVLTLNQNTDIRNSGDYYPETHEDTFDRGIMIAQQHQDEIDRSFKLPESVSSAAFNPTFPADILNSANKVPVMNAAGTGIALVTEWPSALAISGATTSAAAAAASAAAALISETAAAASAIAALASQNAAAASAGTASTDAGTATTQAGIATTQAGISTTQAGISTAQAVIATTKAAEAVVSAGTATTQAAAAVVSAAAALVSQNAALVSQNAASASAAAAAASAAGATAIGLGVYASDAAFVVAYGVATAGDIYYNSTLNQARLYASGAWGSVGGGGLTVVAVQTLAAAGSITNSVTTQREMLHVKGTTTPTTASTTPFGTAGTWVDGSEKVIIGNDDDATLIITANDAANGCVGNFSLIELNKYKTASFFWSTSLSRWIFSAGVQ